MTTSGSGERLFVVYSGVCSGQQLDKKDLFYLIKVPRNGCSSSSSGGGGDGGSGSSFGVNSCKLKHAPNSDWFCAQKLV